MSENTETPKILDQIAKGTGSRSTRSQQNARRRFFIVMLLFIPVLAGLAYVSYFQLNIQQRLSELENQNIGLSSRLAGFEEQLATLTAEIAALPEQVQIDETATVELGNRLDTELDAVRSALRSLSAAQQQDNEPQTAQWKILEAEYLLQLATRKLQFESDINTAILLLEQADKALLESDNSDVFGARQAVSADLSTLRALEPVDREGLYIRLQSLITQVSDLPLRGSMQEEFQNRGSEQANAVQPTPDGETGVLDRTFAFLGSVFVWREWEEMPEAMLAPGQDLLIKQRLRLSLEQLQLALTGGDGALFASGVSESLRLFESYIVVDNPASQSLLSDLRALQEIDISPVLPSLAASLERVAQLAAGLR